MADSLYTFTFGKYKGKDIEDVPTEYLTWLAEQAFFEKEYPVGIKAINTELKYREKWDG
jgi:uncharacterized protein (DUF3820 family)